MNEPTAEDLADEIDEGGIAVKINGFHLVTKGRVATILASAALTYLATKGISLV